MSILVDYAITAGSDDAYQQGTTMYIDLINHRVNASSIQTGQRFLDVQIPQGATILNAYIAIYSNLTVTQMSLGVSVEAADNPSTYTTADSNISGRSYGSSVNWALTPPPIDQYINSPSLTALIQAIVDRPGWAEGNAIAVRFIGTTGYDLRYTTYENAGNLPPRLYIEYEGTPDLPPTVALNTPDLSTLGTTPTLQFTGTDDNSDDIRYQIQISDDPDFGGAGSRKTSSREAGSGIVHPNPAATLTWEGKYQIDDRVGQSLNALGGILDKVYYKFGADVDTDGYAVVRVYEHQGTFGTSSAPLNAVPYNETPTPGWIAQSATLYCDTTLGTEYNWREFAFVGDQRIRLVNGQHYMIMLDWWPNDTLYDNTITVNIDSLLSGAGHPGNLYLDGFSQPNWGPHADWDAQHQFYEVMTQLDELSTGTGNFENTVTPSDTDPFNSGEKIAFTVPTVDALDDGVTYYWRVRAIDPAGSNTWGDWTTARSFSVTADAAIEESISLAITLRLTEPQEIPAIEDAISVGRLVGAGGSELAEMIGEAAIVMQRAIAGTDQIEITESASIGRIADAGGAEIGELGAAISLDAQRTISAADLLEVLASIAIAAQRTTVAGGLVDVQEGLDLARVVTTAIADNAEVSDAVALARRVTTAVNIDIPGVEESVSIGRVQAIAAAGDMVFVGAISLDRIHTVAWDDTAEVADSVSLAYSLAVAADGQSSVNDLATISRTHAVTAAGESGGDIEASITLARTEGVSVVDLAEIQDLLNIVRVLDTAILDNVQVDSLVELARVLEALAYIDAENIVEASISLALQRGMSASALVTMEPSIDLARLLSLTPVTQLDAQNGVTLLQNRLASFATQAVVSGQVDVSFTLQLAILALLANEHPPHRLITLPRRGEDYGMSGRDYTIKLPGRRSTYGD